MIHKGRKIQRETKAGTWKHVNRNMERKFKRNIQYRDEKQFPHQGVYVEATMYYGTTYLIVVKI